MRSSLLILCLLSILSLLRAQDPSAKNDCFGSSILTLKLDKPVKDEQSVRKARYSKKDRFTFWYRLKDLASDTLRVVITSTDPKDIYDISLYRYDGNSVCKELVHGDPSPLGIGSLEDLPNKGAFPGHHPVAFQDEVLEKEGTYYLSVMQVGGKGCGHIARFKSGSRKIEVRAKARECFEVPEAPEKGTQSDKTEEVTLRTGLLDSNDKRSIAGELMLMNRKTGKKRFIDLSTDSVRSVKVRKGRSYRLEGEALGYHSKSVEKVLNSDSSIFLNLSSLDKGEKIVLRRIYFHPNTYAFRDQSHSSLQALYRYMKDRPKAVIEIQGHTASDKSIENINPLYKDKGPAWKFTGTAKELSRLRAQAVKEALMAKGIGADRMRIKGFGASRKLVKDPRSRRQEQKNMRVEVRILK